jgi:hypothetical protein
MYSAKCIQQLMKVVSNVSSTAINQHIVKECKLSQVFVNGLITCTYYGWGPQIFQNPSGNFKNLDVRRVTSGMFLT